MQSFPVALVDEEYSQHTLDLRTSRRPAIVHDGARYTLRDLVLHAPSENAIAGRRFDAEIQLVHVAPGPRSAACHTSKL
jgi:carbonic anhydrase